MLKGGEVSHYIIGGADLMYPGISIPPEGLPLHSAGEPWAVKVPGNQAPIAVSHLNLCLFNLLDVEVCLNVDLYLLTGYGYVFI